MWRYSDPDSRPFLSCFSYLCRELDSDLGQTYLLTPPFAGLRQKKQAAEASGVQGSIAERGDASASAHSQCGWA